MARHTTKFTGIIYRDSVTNGKLDKTYYIRYKDENNKTVELKIGKYSEGIREAYCNQKRNEILTKQRNGEEPPIIIARKKRKILNIDTVANKYFKERPNIDGSIKGYYKNHILVFFKDYDFENISKKDIQKFTETLTLKKGLRTDEPLAPKTLNNILNLLRTIAKFALKNDLIKNDFTKYIELFDLDNARERFLSRDEIQSLYDATKDDELLFTYFKLALNTGARLSTLRNICKKDIDFNNNLLTLKDFKNNSTYKIFFNEGLKNLLEKRVESLSFNDKIINSYPQRRISKILDDLFNAGLDFNDRKNKIVFHSLRHTFASHLAISGTPIFTIQKLMNHQDIKMTLRYAKLSPDSGKEAVINLGF